jgi:AraC-like DNA-binding protein
MRYAEFAGDLPADSRISFSCAEENEEVLKSYGVTQEQRQLEKGSFQASLAVTSVAEVTLYSDRFDTALSVYCEPPPGRISMLFTRCAEGQYHANGDDVADGALVFIPDGCGPDIVASGLFGSDSIEASEERLQRSVETLYPDLDLPDRTTILKPDAEQQNRLQAGIVKLLNTPAPDPQRTIDLMESAIVAMCETFQRTQSVPLNTLYRTRIAKRAQAFINEHYTDPIHIEDLCRATEVGVRSLQRAFRGYFDITITEYIKTVRLDMAYRALTIAHHAEHTITEVALAHGFRHLGRFSVTYGDRLGESPTETLAAVPVFRQSV